jgi:hypothetical protein
MYVDHREADLLAIDQQRRSVTATLADKECEVKDSGGDLYEGDIRYGTDAKRRVETTSITTSPVTVTVIRLDDERNPVEHTDLVSGESAAIDGNSVAIVRTPVLMLLRSETPGTVHRTDEETRIEFDEEADVIVGFENRDDRVGGVVKVKRTPEGVARALTSLGVAITETSPDRTWPNLRDYPPRIQFTDSRPETANRFQQPDVDTEVVVPKEHGLDGLLPTAPLIHYLGATASVEEGAEAHVRAGSSRFPLGDDPETIDETASAYLRRVFFLDCHARDAGPHGKPLGGDDVLENLDLSAEYLYEAPLSERVRTYLSLSEEETEYVDETIPEWHLGVHVAPQFDKVPSLTHHLSRLADVYRPESASLTTLADRGEWAEQEKAEAMTRGASVAADEVMVDPADRAETVGWQAARRALGAFNVVDGEVPPERPLIEDDISVTVVLASNSMSGEAVVDAYQKRELPLDAKFVTSPNKQRLKELIEEPTDLLHYIGHHEEEGLQCRDGYLPFMHIDEVGCQAFFLNACGSIQYGEQLVKRGAAAGAVTTRAVFDEHATSVGIDWAQLVSLGWSVERALDYARSISDPSGYVAVGDGAHVVTQSETTVPPLVRIFENEDDYSVEVSYNGPRHVGMRTVDRVSEKRLLSGKQREYTLSTDGLRDYLKTLSSPAFYKNELYWQPEKLF